MTESLPLLESTLAAIVAPSASAYAAAQEAQRQLTKPPGALGRLEDLGCQLAAIADRCPPPIPRRALVSIFAGDHGVWAQQVSPWPQEVTTQMVATMAAGGAGGSVLARQVGADLVITDLGLVTPAPQAPSLRSRRIAPGTADLSRGPAMTLTQARAAIDIGIETARDAVAQGYQILIPGEVGIANTTPAAALVGVFSGRPAIEVTGCGAGATGPAFERKVRIVADAAARASAANPLAALAEVGGFEHAAMVGLYLGAAAARVPVLLDGLIACSAALVAHALCPTIRGYLIAGHAGREPGIAAALDALGLDPLVALGFALGEGTGGAIALPIVQASARILHEMATFASAGVSGSAA